MPVRRSAGGTRFGLMASIEYPDYLGHLRSESRRFREVLATCDPKARVPACPDWDAADLLWHLAGVQWFWSNTIRTRPAPADEDAPRPDRPDSYDGLLAAFDEYSASLVSELERADPAEPAWTWSDEQTVGFTFRRQAHEALIHRLDAEQTADDVTPLDPTLAADGVLECLDIMFGGCPPWGQFNGLPHYVRVDCTDTGDRIWVQIGRFVGTDPDDGQSYDEDDVNVVPDPGVEADAVVEGGAAALDTWLWRRTDDSEVTVHGDLGIYARFRGAIDNPIN
jgi:uncharacterized protein (TIGR03083 family)